MDLYELSAFMFMLKPYVDELIGGMEKGPIEMLQGLMQKVSGRDPADIFRLLAMMYHVDAVTFEYDKSIKPSELVSAFVDGFSENKLPDMIQSGFALGLYDRGLDGVYRDSTRGRSQ
jgi:hypothetical protein